MLRGQSAETGFLFLGKSYKVTSSQTRCLLKCSFALLCFIWQLTYHFMVWTLVCNDEVVCVACDENVLSWFLQKSPGVAVYFGCLCLLHGQHFLARIVTSAHQTSNILYCIWPAWGTSSLSGVFLRVHLFPKIWVLGFSCISVWALYPMQLANLCISS